VFWIEDLKTSERHRKIIVQCGHNRLSHREADGREESEEGGAAECDSWFSFWLAVDCNMYYWGQVIDRSAYPEQQNNSVDETVHEVIERSCGRMSCNPDGITKLDCRACCVEMHCIAERNVTRLTNASFPGRIFNTAVFVFISSVQWEFSRRSYSSLDENICLEA
jgi:hypothetical protein